MYGHWGFCVHHGPWHLKGFSKAHGTPKPREVSSQILSVLAHLTDNNGN